MNPSVKINLEFASALAVDDNPQALELLCSILAALGIKDIVRCTSAAEGMDACQRRRFDLVITDGQMPDMDGYEFVHWIRRTGPVEGRLVPVLVFTAHSRRSQVMRARDCGANFIVSKPLSPKVLLERIYWVAKATRMFIECETYVGPDRRFKMQGPPAEFPDGRRRDDVAGEISGTAGDNMSQEELSAMIAPQKVSL